CSSSYVLLRISRGHPHLYAFPTRRSSDLVQIVGGLEHMQHIPMDAGIDLNPKLFERTSKGALMMGVTAEFLAQTQGISREEQDTDRKSTRLNSSHQIISYAVFCLKKKNIK